MLHYFRFWRELRHNLATIFLIYLSPAGCTISVSEGNYDSKTRTWEGIPYFSLHYFRFWRELRLTLFSFTFSHSFPVLHYFRFWRELRLITCVDGNVTAVVPCCTISVSEGNYDPPKKFFLFLFWVVSVALFPFLKGITTWVMNGW